jgi:hypothetical protein
MKSSVKKLRTCVYSKPVAPSGLFSQESHQTNKLVCDHPEMKVNWQLERCTGCTVYVNRNQPPEPPPDKKKGRGRKTKAKS